MNDAGELDEGTIHNKWLELAPLIDRMMERVGTEDEFPVAPHSSLALDNAATNPYHLSHALRMCLTAAVDHLHALKVLVVDAGVLHVAAPSSLSRGALENLAAAFWILGPEDRTDRVERLLQWYAKNFKDSQTATAGINIPDRTSLDDKLKKLYAVGAHRSIDPRKIRNGYTSTDAVTYAEQNAPNLPLGVVLPWRLCSGFAHGRPWAYLGSLHREEVDRGNDISTVKLTSDLGRTLYPALASMQLLELFLRLYSARAETGLA